MQKDYFTLEEYFSLKKELEVLNKKEKKPKIKQQLEEIRNKIKELKQNGQSDEDLKQQYNEVIGAKKKNEIREKLNKMLKFNQNNLEYTEYTLLQPLWYQNKFIPKNTLVAVSKKTNQLLPYLYFDKNENYKGLKNYKTSVNNGENVILYDNEIMAIINNNNDSSVKNIKQDIKQYKADNNEYRKKQIFSIVPAIPNNVLSYKNVYSKYLTHKSKNKRDDIMSFIRRNFKIYEEKRDLKILTDFNIKKYSDKKLQNLEFIQKYNKII